MSFLANYIGKRSGAFRVVLALILINVAGFFALNIFGNMVSDISGIFNVPETLVNLVIVVVAVSGAIAVLSLPLRRK